MKTIFAPVIHFLFRIGYFGPFVMGVMDSSFLVLPFGNDLLVVGMVASHRGGLGWYILSAAVGSTTGALLLALVARKLGTEGIRRLAGERRYNKLNQRIGRRAGPAVALAGLAPPPFPFTTVIAAAAAVKYPIWRILIINFLARGVRFSILAVSALRFGTQVLRVAKSASFEWGMFAFIVLCLLASGVSLWQWWHKTRDRGPAG